MTEAIAFDRWSGWDDVRYCPQHFFQTRAWFQVLTSSWPGLRIELLPISERCVLPVFRRTLGPLRLIGSPLRGYYTPYGGCLGLADYDQLAERLAADFCEVTLSPGNRAGVGWDLQRTILVDLRQGIDRLWAHLDGNCRNKVRQAEKRGVEVREGRGNDWVDDYYELVRSTYARQNLAPPASPVFFRSIAQHLLPGHAKVLLAYYEGHAVAGAILCMYANTVYYLDGALDRSYQRARANTLIQWEVLRWAASAGFAVYDMLGANIPSIATFKRSFGGFDVAYPRLQWTATLRGNLAWRCYQRLQMPWKRLQAWRSPR